jgi:hypothetical protein
LTQRPSNKNIPNDNGNKNIPFHNIIYILNVSEILKYNYLLLLQKLLKMVTDFTLNMFQIFIRCSQLLHFYHWLYFKLLPPFSNYWRKDLPIRIFQMTMEIKTFHSTILFIFWMWVKYWNTIINTGRSARKSIPCYSSHLFYCCRSF